MALVDNLVAYWALGEASGDALDSHGSNTLAQTSGTIATTGSGLNGNARDFEAGDTEYFAINDNAALSMGDIDFTIGCWIYAESLAAEADIISKYETVGNQREYRLKYDSATSRLQFVASSDGSSVVTLPFGSLGAPATSTKYFLLAWHDSIGNTVNVQANDGTVNTSSHTLGVLNGTSPFHIGALGRAAVALHWDGLINNAFIYKRVLTSLERTELYNSGNGRDYAYIAGAPSTAIKTINGLARASVKTRNGLAIASMKNLNGLV